MTGLFDSLANPTRFRTLSAVIRPFCFWAAAIFFIFGLYLALLASPPDYQQGDAVRIMYVHVPAAWLGLSSYLGLGLCALSAELGRFDRAPTNEPGLQRESCSWASSSSITRGLEERGAALLREAVQVPQKDHHQDAEVYHAHDDCNTEDKVCPPLVVGVRDGVVLHEPIALD